MDDDPIKHTRILLQYPLQVCAEGLNIGGVIRRIPQHLDLLEEAAAVREHRKRKIFVDMHLVIDQPRLVGLADPYDQGSFSRGAHFPRPSSCLAKNLERKVGNGPLQ